ncbi:hypothetical protein IX84_28605 [Phaeodactylibacter xiamenensis]|uniref:Transaldolase n=1 Tax=Phaeodactylibacter xiamenensis TaxID=1524460 RepID=A0A098S2P3_9BACT|nr:hypothetical protein IX84_28605 [Phaeodactylibacter xiamenensis]
MTNYIYKCRGIDPAAQTTNPTHFKLLITQKTFIFVLEEASFLFKILFFNSLQLNNTLNQIKFLSSSKKLELF